LPIASGCGTAGLIGFLDEIEHPRIAKEEIETRRTRFVQNRDPDAFRWLLGHMLDNGMTLADVNQALGEPGELVYDDQEIKTDNEKLLQTDLVYRWGPTSDGKSVALYFRDGRLIHFHRKHFAASEPPDSF
jgi:hypothetical protein